jgi:histidinol phosphatase-like enzyme (inositol monophosphatase family)
VKLSVLLEAAIDVARVAGDVALGHFKRGVSPEWKPDGSPVTPGDREAERAAREWLEKRFPQDGILGEEEGLTRGDARRRWILDPIDGTKTFLRRVPLWGTLVAVAEGEEILAGVAYFPAVAELLAAAPGEGCFCNGVKSSVSQVSDLRKATVLATDSEFGETPGYRKPWEALVHQAGISRTWGDCYGYLMVATGRAEAMVDGKMAPWDAACLLPIIEEAGGVLTDWQGRRTAFGGSTIATNRALDVPVRSTLVSRPP